MVTPKLARIKWRTNTGGGTMRRHFKHHVCAAALGIASVTFASAACAQNAAEEPTGHGPSAKDWSDLAKLPDWTGVWQPDVLDQNRQAKENKYPWNPVAAAEIAKGIQLEQDGKADGTHNSCLPWGMPGFMMLTHNAVEFLFTPGRLTILGELDGNNLRRIYTDGRPHPADPDATFHGHSIGHWENKTLVVDTVAILPEVEIALSEGVGIPGGDGMHIVEHIHNTSANIMADDMEITAPKVFSATYKTRRDFFRRGWGPNWDIVEGVCLQGNFIDQVDKDGHALFVPKPQSARP